MSSNDKVLYIEHAFLKGSILEPQSFGNLNLSKMYIRDRILLFEHVKIKIDNLRKWTETMHATKTNRKNKGLF